MTEQGKREWVIEGLEFTLEESGWDANAAYDQELMIQVVTEAIALLEKHNDRFDYKVLSEWHSTLGGRAARRDVEHGPAGGRNQFHASRHGDGLSVLHHIS